MLVTTRRGVLIGRRRGEVGGYKNEETRRKTTSAAGGLITGRYRKEGTERDGLVNSATGSRPFDSNYTHPCYKLSLS